VNLDEASAGDIPGIESDDILCRALERGGGCAKMDATTVSLSLNEENVSETPVASLEGLSVPIVIVDVLKGHCFFYPWRARWCF
jgi:hypothetical protein